MNTSVTSWHPHQGQPMLQAGTPLEQAQAAVILIHGRGATASDILELATLLPQSGIAFLAPQAAANNWYPNRFIAPTASNEPWLSSALKTIANQLERVNQAGIPPERTLLLGFSQGACLVLEFAARRPQRYGGVAGLSGALIGAPEEPRPESPGALQGTPVFIGCGQEDPFIPAERVRFSADHLRGIGATVTTRFYPGGEHRVYSDEIEILKEMVDALAGVANGAAPATG